MEPRSSDKHSNFALLIIDVQKGLFEKSTPIYRGDQLLQNINMLVERAHDSGVPVFYIQHADQRMLAEGSDGWQLHPQLQPRELDGLIHKRHGNAFEATTLDQELGARGITSLVITGLVTHGCVRATCIGGKQAGYHVILVRDGHSNYHKQAAKLIEEWNQKLGDGIVELKWAHEIDFGRKE